MKIETRNERGSEAMRSDLREARSDYLNLFDTRITSVGGLLTVLLTGLRDMKRQSSTKHILQ
jgi:hypothetical protein